MNILSLKRSKDYFTMQDSSGYVVTLPSGEKVERFRQAESFSFYPYQKTTIGYDEIKDNKYIFEIGTAGNAGIWFGNNFMHGPKGETVDVPLLFDLLAEYDPDMLKDVRDRKCMIHIDQLLEGFPLVDSNYNYYDHIYENLDKHNLPATQIIYSTSNLYEKINQEKYDSRKEIHVNVNPVFAINASNHWFYESEITELSHEQHIAHKTNSYVKLYSCLNRVIRPHRVALGTMLNYYGLLNDADFSHNKIDVHYPRYFEETESLNNTTVKNFMSTLPRYIDQIDFNINQAQNLLSETYLNTWFSLITETHFHEYKGYSMFFSEKIFKPIRMKHPFVLVGQTNSLRELRKFGFKTFDKWWNESYDDIDNPNERLEEICKLVKELKAKSHTEWLDIYYDMKEVLDYNYNVLARCCDIDSTEFLRKVGYV